jgi:hypothetical protein
MVSQGSSHRMSLNRSQRRTERWLSVLENGSIQGQVPLVRAASGPDDAGDHRCLEGSSAGARRQPRADRWRRRPGSRSRLAGSLRQPDVRRREDGDRAIAAANLPPRVRQDALADPLSPTLTTLVMISAKRSGSAMSQLWSPGTVRTSWLPSASTTEMVHAQDHTVAPFPTE